MGVVYLIYDKNSNSYKIGVTKSKASKRLAKLQTGNSNELKLVKTFETEYPFRVETILHNQYNYTKKLNEWFELQPIDVINFEKTCEDIVKNINALKDNYYFSKNLK